MNATPKGQGTTDSEQHAAERMAQRFHEAYERLAPSFGYETREASRKPWADVPEQNRRLMTAVCAEVLGHKSKVWGNCGDCGGHEFGVFERCMECGAEEILELLVGDPLPPAVAVDGGQIESPEAAEPSDP